MTLQTFFQRHFSTSSGESPIGHALAISAGFALLVVGTMLVASVVWIPAGIVMSVAGLLALVGGVWAHISNPLDLDELADSMVKLISAAIAVTFGLAVAAIIIGFVLTLVVSFVRFIAS